MKKHLTGMTFIMLTLCVTIASKASILPKNHLFSIDYPIHRSDSDGFFSSELSLTDVSKSVNFGFNQKRLSPFGFPSPHFSENPISTLNSEFSRRNNYRYGEPSNKIKIGLSLITTVLEFHYYTPDGGQRFRNLNDSENYWIAQLGIHPFWIDQFYFGIKRGVVYNHLEASLGVAFSMASEYFFESPLFPTFNVGFTTLGLKSKLRFNCGIGLPEIIYVGTSYSL
jgi:hypothetical protein